MSSVNNNTVVWLIGASSGIGEEIAVQLSNLGAKLIISSRREAELLRVKGQCENSENIHILPVDLADAESLDEKANTALGIYGHIDILINSGGVSQRSKIVDTAISVDRRLMEINYFGAVALSRALLPSMIKRKSGHHVLLSSATGIISTPLRSSYAASKHALHGFYDALRAEHFEDNIKVSLICPGYVKTNISLNALTADGSKQNIMDKAQENGMTPEYCVRRIIKAIKRDEQEVYIGGMKEVSGIYLKRFFPSLFAKVITKIAVT